jgi:diaminohydroxyphosphoribosylaminopyrimidine deaminase/5-amino-6-(5-phosphoribosylamino)uracil reductase
MIDRQGASSVELEAMRRALSVAAQGPAGGENPRVGCVILGSSGEIVAEGFHRGAGTAHAEVDALTDLSSKGITPTGLTAVVTLEPCNHQGKTGPCAQALIEAGIGQVITERSWSGRLPPSSITRP